MKYESIEKAKVALAENKWAEYEATKAERIRTHKIIHEQALAAEKEAEEEVVRASESVEQYGTRLLEKMKKSVITRFENGVSIELRKQVTEDFKKNTKPLLKQAMRDGVYRELFEELSPVVEAELSKKLIVHVRDNLEKELRPIVEAQLKEQLCLKAAAPAVASQSITAKENIEAGLSSPKLSLYPDLSHFANDSEQPVYLEEADPNISLEELSHDSQVKGPKDTSTVEEVQDSAEDASLRVKQREKPAHKRSLDDDEAADQNPAKRSKTEKSTSDIQTGNGLSEDVEHNQSSETLQQFDAQSGGSTAWDDMFVKDNEEAHTKQDEDTTAVTDASHGKAESFTAVNANEDGKAEGVQEAQEEALFLPDYEDEEEGVSESEYEGEELPEDGNESLEEGEEEVEPVSIESSENGVESDSVESSEDEEITGAHRRLSNPNNHSFEKMSKDPFNQPYGVKPKVNAETGEIEEDSEEDEEYDSEDDELPRTKIQKSMIAVTNTQDTAYVIDSSDEEDGDKTLVAETVEETTVLIKKEADLDGAFEEETVAETEVEA